MHIVLTKEQIRLKTEAIISEFADKNGECCAGCRWWQYANTVVGQCTKTAPVSGDARLSMIGGGTCSMPIPSGHILTERSHYCGDFSTNEINDGNK